jgi:predicted GTPase
MKQTIRNKYTKFNMHSLLFDAKQKNIPEQERKEHLKLKYLQRKQSQRKAFFVDINLIFN